jgi:hypothetical protein
MGNRMSASSAAALSPEERWKQPLARKGSLNEDSPQPVVMIGRNQEHPTTYYVFGPPEGMAYSKQNNNHQTVHIRRLVDPSAPEEINNNRPGMVTFNDQGNSVTLSAVELEFIRGEDEDDKGVLYDHFDAGDQEVAQVESSGFNKHYQSMAIYTPNGLRPFARFQADKWNNDRTKRAQYVFRDCSGHRQRQHHGVVGADRLHWAFRSQVVEPNKRENTVVAKVEGVGGWKKNADHAQLHDQQSDWDRSTDQYLKLTIAPGVDHGAILLMVLNKYVLANCRKQ